MESTSHADSSQNLQHYLAVLFLPPPANNCYPGKTQSALRAEVQVAQKWSVVMLPPTGSSGDSLGGSSRGNRCFENNFPNSSSLFWPRDRERTQQKEVLLTLKSTVTKLEERAADLKLRVEDFSSEREADVQVHPKVEVKWDSTAMSCSSSHSHPSQALLSKLRSKQSSSKRKHSGFLLYSFRGI